MTRWRIAKGLLLLAFITGLAYVWYLRRASPARDQQPLATVSRRNLVLKVTVAGGITPAHSALITPPYDGYIRKLYVKIGEKVKMGQPIVTIGQTVGQTEQAFPLRSSLDGTVVQIGKTVGEHVSQTPSASNGEAPIVRIDDLTKLYVKANVAELDIEKLNLGQPVLIRTLAVPDKVYHGRIVTIDLAAREEDHWDKARVEFPITAEILDQDEHIKPGMSGILDIIIQEAAGVLALPQEFVAEENGHYYVTLAGGERRRVEIGLKTDEMFEITSGLKEGDLVRQVDFLAEGADDDARR